jgi:chromosome partitioning protein
MKTITILSQKGGPGKTTTTLNLAVAAQEAGLSVLVLDLDPQASATMWHQARDNKTPHVQPTHAPALEAVRREAKAQGVDLLLIDTAPQTDAPASAAAEVADLVLIPCRPSVMDLRAIQNTIRLCRNANVAHSVVLTQIEPQGRLHEEARATLQGLKVDVLPVGLGRRAAFHHSLIDGRTALEYEPEGKAALEVRDLFRHVCQLVNMTTRQQEESNDPKAQRA